MVRFYQVGFETAVSVTRLGTATAEPPQVTIKAQKHASCPSLQPLQIMQENISFFNETGYIFLFSNRFSIPDVLTAIFSIFFFLRGWEGF